MSHGGFSPNKWEPQDPTKPHVVLKDMIKNTLNDKIRDKVKPVGPSVGLRNMDECYIKGFLSATVDFLLHRENGPQVRILTNNSYLRVLIEIHNWMPGNAAN